MSTGDWFLVCAAFTATAGLVSSVPIRRTAPILIIPIFVIGYLSSELAWFFMVLQVLVSVAFLAAGALMETTGVVALIVMAVSLLALMRLHRQSHDANLALQTGLHEALGTDFLDRVPASRRQLRRTAIDSRDWLRPVSMQREAVERLSDIPYGEAGERNLLDIYRARGRAANACPVLLQIHGGGWFMGHKQQQALPLMNHLAERGWLCVSINYRLSPDHTFPAHIIDVKKAIVWVRHHIAEYGGDPAFIAVTGGSAGGHLTALAALSTNDPAYQPGFEHEDTRVQAAVPMYGVYDFLDRSGQDRNAALRGFVEEKVLQCTPADNRELWERSSPIARLCPDAPPFFVIHGGHDIMTSFDEARDFAVQLKAVSQQPVVHAELPGAQHAFDCIHSVRTEYLLNHVTDFLEWTHAGSNPGSAGIDDSDRQ